jgi:type IV secretion system protein VirD4
MDRYRGHVWESIISACDRQILLGLNEHKTNGEWWAEKTGYITIEIGTERRNGGGLLDMEILNDEGLMSSTGVGRRLLMLPDEIQSMGRNFALLFINGYHVKKVRKFDYMDHPMAKEIKETSPYRHEPAWWKSVEKESWFVIQKKELTKQWEAQDAEKVAQKKVERDVEPSPQPDEFEQFQKIFRTALVHGELKPLFKELKAYFIALYHFTRGFFEGKEAQVQSASAPAEAVSNEVVTEPSQADTTEEILEEILKADEETADVVEEPKKSQAAEEPSDDDFFIDCREKGGKTLVKSKKL